MYIVEYGIVYIYIEDLVYIVYIYIYIYVYRVLYGIVLPGPRKYVESWPSGLLLEVLGHYLTYFGGLGRPQPPCLAGRQVQRGYAKLLLSESSGGFCRGDSGLAGVLPGLPRVRLGTSLSLPHIAPD